MPLFGQTGVPEDPPLVMQQMKMLFCPRAAKHRALERDKFKKRGCSLGRALATHLTWGLAQLVTASRDYRDLVAGGTGQRRLGLKLKFGKEDDDG